MNFNPEHSFEGYQKSDLEHGEIKNVGRGENEPAANSDIFEQRERETIVGDGVAANDQVMGTSDVKRWQETAYDYKRREAERKIAELEEEIRRLRETASVEAEQLSMVLGHADQKIGDALAQANTAEKVAVTDQLTQIMNRKGLQASGEKMLHDIQEGTIRSCGAMFIDLDGFKALNDTYGHQAGDECLKLVADLLVGSSREGDAVARLGGDEFVLLFPNLDEVAASQRGEEILSLIRTKISDKLKEQYVSQDASLWSPSPLISASIGVSEVTNEEVKERVTFDAVLERADKAMYSAKKTGKGKVVLLSALQEERKVA
jgi:diguanylate cyclase (GGDEF)-like protein